MNGVTSKKNGSHYVWGDNCDSWVLSALPGLSVKQERMPAGAKEQLHYHERAAQFFFVLNGKATFYVEEQKIELKEQEGITIEKKRKHLVANESEEVVEFLVISQPDTINDRINK